MMRNLLFCVLTVVLFLGGSGYQARAGTSPPGKEKAIKHLHDYAKGSVAIVQLPALGRADVSIEAQPSALSVPQQYVIPVHNTFQVRELPPGVRWCALKDNKPPDLSKLKDGLSYPMRE